jgi:hypothetical protein
MFVRSETHPKERIDHDIEGPHDQEDKTHLGETELAFHSIERRQIEGRR